jgi:hypothetical protein
MMTSRPFKNTLVHRVLASGSCLVPALPLMMPAMGPGPVPEQHDHGDELGRDPEVRCAVPGSDACRTLCADIGAYCTHRSKHPYKEESGTGDLYWCKGGWPTYTCSYQYTDGDNCHFIYPGGVPLCQYLGGKKEASK